MSDTATFKALLREVRHLSEQLRTEQRARTSGDSETITTLQDGVVVEYATDQLSRLRNQCHQIAKLWRDSGPDDVADQVLDHVIANAADAGLVPLATVLRTLDLPDAADTENVPEPVREGWRAAEEAVRMTFGVDQ